jgi:hypothetical protein
MSDTSHATDPTIDYPIRLRQRNAFSAAQRSIGDGGKAKPIAGARDWWLADDERGVALTEGTLTCSTKRLAAWCAMQQRRARCM